MDSHKFKEYNRSSTPISAVFHGVAGLALWFAAIYDVFYVIPPVEAYPEGYVDFGGRFKYLTYWNLCLQALYMTVSFIVDIVIFSGRTRSSTLGKSINAKDTFEASVGLPIALVVCTAFWSLVLFNRELVLPPNFEKFFPWWLNHLEHSSVGVFQLIELMVTQHRYPSHKIGIGCMVMVELTYAAWMHAIYYVTGYWAYPIFYHFSSAARILFLLGWTVISVLYYFTGYFINWLLWERNKF